MTKSHYSRQEVAEMLESFAADFWQHYKWMNEYDSIPKTLRPGFHASICRLEYNARSLRGNDMINRLHYWVIKNKRPTVNYKWK